MAYTVYEGKDLRIELDDKTIFHETNATISIEREVETITLDSKDVDPSGDWAKKRVKGMSWGAGGDTMICLDDTTPGAGTAHDFKSLYDAFTAGVEIAVKVAIGGEILSGSAFLQSLSPSAGLDGYGTVSFNLEGSGALTLAPSV
ncbi:hypothetical protein [Carboxylicivirga sp. M1479]|uniref:hypothetical protein n=1 Tax=Carboxylicivirga sp. M1479 TaxID=2594476 RepID=UPI0011776BAD|nr:hypothetical protein [Carboxylicivirga sp. M1479]TRX71506.1 hypothetical protein FNN09_05925 [Carboxylicivirga sp. M1479]